MLTEYEQYAMPSGVMDSVCSTSISSTISSSVSSSGHQHEDPYMYSMPNGPWQEPAEDAYTLTVLSDGSSQSTDAPPQPPPPPYMQAWGTESWQQHGPAHAGNPFDDDLVSGSDGSSPDRRCVRSLLHVALQKGGSFAQQFTSCGVPPMQLQPPPSYPVAIKQEPASLSSPLASPGMFVSSTSSPRPVTPADSLRSCYSPSSASAPYPHLMHLSRLPSQHCDDSVVSTTSSYPMSMDAPVGTAAFSPAAPPSYSAFRTPYPTPSPDPCYPPPPRPESFPSPLLPLPVHLMSAAPGPSTPPPTPTSRSAKKRRNRSKPTTAEGGVAPTPRKRERSERQLHPCTLCDKRFKDNYSVNVHMRTHTGEKPFPCIVCGKMFRQKAHLAKHRSTHQPSEWAAAAAAHLPPSHSMSGTLGASLGGSHGVTLVHHNDSVDGNSNSLPLWAESKCKAPNVWTPTIMSPPLSSVQ